MPSEEPLEARLVLLWGHRVDRLLKTAVVTAAVALVARAFAGSGGSFDTPLGALPLDVAWLVFVLGTGAHAFCGRFLIRSVQDLSTRRDLALEDGVREQLLSGGGYFVSVSVRRLHVDEDEESFSRMDLGDASTWTSYAAALLVYAAMLPWHLDGGRLVVASTWSLVVTAVVAALVLVVNWSIGGHWALAVSSLGRPTKLLYWPGLGGPSAEPTLTAGIGCIAVVATVLLVLVAVVWHGRLGL